jgi:hypothetical protein
MKPAAQPIVIGLLSLSLGAVAMLGPLPQLRAAEPHHTVVAGTAVKWGPAPPSLPQLR